MHSHKSGWSLSIVAAKTRPWLPTRGNVIFTVLVISLLFWAQSAGAFPAAAPAGTSTGTIAYQGRLADAAGTPLSSTYLMIFRLYSSATGGAPLWEEQWIGPNSVQVSDGLFNVMLGSLTPIPQNTITGNGSLWLGITIGTDDEMLPRVQLGTVPYAVQALTVPDGSVTSAKIADGSIITAKLANSAVTSAKIADGNVKSRNIAPTFFEATLTSDVAIPSVNLTDNFVAYSLSVNFPVDANYLIFYKSHTRMGVADQRVFTILKDEGFIEIGSAEASVIQNSHPLAGANGSQNGAAMVKHFFTAGSHTINVVASASTTAGAYVRGSSSIIAIPFAVGP
jgi:hypothetical protein